MWRDEPHLSGSKCGWQSAARVSVALLGGYSSMGAAIILFILFDWCRSACPPLPACKTVYEL